MRNTILLIEDHHQTNELYAAYFKRAGFEVLQCERAIEGIEMLRRHQVAAVVLDINLPDYDGFEVCKKIRSKSGVPILFVSSESGVETRLNAYAVGADGFISKPVDLRELTALIWVFIRRSSKIPEVSEKHLFHIDKGTHSISYNDHTLHLTHTEYKILEYFLKNPHTALSRESITFALYLNCQPSAIDFHIKNIRKKLTGAGAHEDVIQSVYGEGYRLNWDWE